MARTKKYTPSQLTDLLPQPAKDANKYTRGKLVCIAGCSDYPGAAALAALAGQRMGAGYTQVVCAPEAVRSVRAASPSLVVSPWDPILEYANISPDERGIGIPQATEISAGASKTHAGAQNSTQAARPAHIKPPPEVLRVKASHPTAFLIGSGMNKNAPETSKLVNATLASVNAPVLADGGALSALTSPSARLILRQRFINGTATVITPHAGEAAVLAHELELPSPNAAQLAQLLSLAYGVIAVVKGPTTFVSDGNATYKMNDGTQALAKAGTGDVLAGMIASLLAQGIKSVDACMLGTTLHARAGIIAAEKFTDICVVPEDVIAQIPAAIRYMSKATAKVK